MNRNIINYDLVWGLEWSKFIREVSLKIVQGWQPLGGAFCDKDGDYVQTIVLYDDVDVEDN